MLAGDDERWASTLCFWGSTSVEDYVLNECERQLLNFPSTGDGVAALEQARRLAAAPGGASSYGLQRLETMSAACTGFMKSHGLSPEQPMRLFGLDTESVIVSTAAMVEREFRTVYDVFVKPDADVVDYVTEHSGVTAELLAGATHSWQTVREEVCRLLQPQDVLVGHDVRQDLLALGVAHERVIDTALLYDYERSDQHCSSLAKLTRNYLHRSIQTSRHCSHEDAVAAVELALLHVAQGKGRVCWRRLRDDEQCQFYALSAADAERVVSGLLHIDFDDAVAMYVRGSRGVGTAAATADWDIVLVVERWPQRALLLSYGNLDVEVFRRDAFEDVLFSHAVWALEAVYVPPPCRWLERLDYRAALQAYRQRTPAELYTPMLRASVGYESARKWNSAKRAIVQQNNRQRCAKHVFICLRFLVYGVEMAEHGCIRDVAMANALWHELRAEQFDTWRQFHDKYAPVRKHWRTQLKRALPKLPRYGGFRGDRRHCIDVDVDQTLPLLSDDNTVADDDDDVFLPAVLRRRFAGRQREATDWLERTLGVVAATHAQYRQLVQLHYTMRSPRSHPWTRQCRGMIVDAGNDWSLVALPFYRFFNAADAEAAAIDWRSARLQEKLDGSLATLYHYDGAWHVASSHRPDGAGLMCRRDPGGPVPFAQLFWRVWRAVGYSLDGCDADLAYMFELVTPRHAIIVRYPDERLVLLGARSRTTLRELPAADVAARHGWQCARHVDLPLSDTGDDEANKAAVLRAAEALDGRQAEGYVVCDGDYNRIKAKNSDYVRLSWMFPVCPKKHSMNARHMLVVLLAGEQREFAAYCPEFRPDIEHAEQRLQRFVGHVQRVYATIADIDDRRHFAAAANAHPDCAPLLFALHKGQSVMSALAQMPVKNVERLLDNFQ